jgi:hypothetical protein
MRNEPWSTEELTAIAVTAADNALDDAGDGPMIQTFESELEFQLNAPEHRGRPALTEPQITLVRAIWDREIQANGTIG